MQMFEIEIVPLTLDGWLNPNFRGRMKISFKFDYLQGYRTIRPVVVPAYNAIAFLWVVAMSFEATGSKLKFNPYQFLFVTDPAISDAVRKLRTNFFNAELLTPCDMRKEEDHANFILGRILKGCIGQRIWPGSLHPFLIAN